MPGEQIVSAFNFAKSSIFAVGLTVVIAAGLLLIPDDSIVIRAAYGGIVAFALLSVLIFVKPREPYVRSNLKFFAAGCLVIAVALLLGA